MEKTCTFLGFINSSFESKDTGETIAYARVWVWDEKDGAKSYPISPKKTDVALNFGDSVTVLLYESTNFKGQPQIKCEAIS